MAGNPYAVIKNIRDRMFSPKGKNIMVFCVFILISTLLWMVMALNEDVQRDIKTDIRITNCPDSITRVSDIPEWINISVKGMGTQLFAYGLGHRPCIDIDYRQYERNGVISLKPDQLRGLARRHFGQNATVLSINPDSLYVTFTSLKPKKLPLMVDAQVTTLPNCALTGPIKATVDSVLVYSVSPLPDRIRHVSTNPIRLADVAGSQTMKVKVHPPRGCRTVPDSVTVNISVEPMISRSSKVLIKPIHLPAGVKMILLPSAISVNYTQPMSRYDESTPNFVVTADYSSLDRDLRSNKIKVELTKADGNFINVYLSTDSVEYIIERK